MADTTSKTDNQVGAVTGLIDLYTKLGTLGSSKGQSVTETTATDPAAIQAAVNAVLTSGSGVASTAGAAKSAGLYSSSTQKQLMQNLLSTAAAKAGGTGTTTTRTVNSGGSAANANKNLLGMTLLSQVANSKLGKKAASSIADEGETAVDSAVQAISNYFGGSDAGTGAMGAITEEASPGGAMIGVPDILDFITSAATDAATEAAVDAGSEAAVAATTDAAASEGGSSIWDEITGYFGFAEGGRVPNIAGYAAGGKVSSSAHSGKVELLPLIELLGQYSAAQSGGGVSAGGAAGTSDSGTSVDGGGRAGPGAGGVLGDIVSSMKGLSETQEEAAARLADNLVNAGGKALSIVAPTSMLLGNNPLVGMLGSKGRSIGLDWLAEQLGIKGAITTAGAEAARDADWARGTEARENAGLPGIGVSGRQSEYEDALARAEGDKGLLQAIQDFQAQQAQNQSDWDSGTFNDNNGGASEPSPGAESIGSPDSFSFSDATDGFAKGGRVRGDSQHGVDDVKAMLKTPGGMKPVGLDGGEFVLTAKSTQMIDQLFGPEFLEQLNGLGKSQKGA